MVLRKKRRRKKNKERNNRWKNMDEEKGNIGRRVEMGRDMR